MATKRKATEITEDPTAATIAPVSKRTKRPPTSGVVHATTTIVTSSESGQARDADHNPPNSVKSGTRPTVSPVSHHNGVAEESTILPRLSASDVETEMSHSTASCFQESGFLAERAARRARFGDRAIFEHNALNVLRNARAETEMWKREYEKLYVETSKVERRQEELKQRLKSDKEVRWLRGELKAVREDNDKIKLESSLQGVQIEKLFDSIKQLSDSTERSLASQEEKIKALKQDRAASEEENATLRAQVAALQQAARESSAITKLNVGEDEEMKRLAALTEEQQREADRRIEDLQATGQHLHRNIEHSPAGFEVIVPNEGTCERIQPDSLDDSGLGNSLTSSMGTPAWQIPQPETVGQRSQDALVGMSNVSDHEIAPAMYQELGLFNLYPNLNPGHFGSEANENATVPTWQISQPAIEVQPSYPTLIDGSGSNILQTAPIVLTSTPLFGTGTHRGGFGADVDNSGGFDDGHGFQEYVMGDGNTAADDLAIRDNASDNKMIDADSAPYAGMDDDEQYDPSVHFQSETISLPKINNTTPFDPKMGVERATGISEGLDDVLTAILQQRRARPQVRSNNRRPSQRRHHQDQRGSLGCGRESAPSPQRNGNSLRTVRDGMHTNCAGGRRSADGPLQNSNARPRGILKNSNRHHSSRNTDPYRPAPYRPRASTNRYGEQGRDRSDARVHETNSEGLSGRTGFGGMNEEVRRRTGELLRNSSEDQSNEYEADREDRPKKTIRFAKTPDDKVPRPKSSIAAESYAFERAAQEARRESANRRRAALLNS